MLAVCASVQIWAGADGDKEFCLYIAEQIFAGKEMYLQMFEPSPPMIFWLLTIPVAIGSWLGAMNGYVLGVLTLMLCSYSVWLCLCVLRAHPQFAGDAGRNRFIAFVLAYIFVVWASPAHFGDREHLIMALVLPYIISKLPGISSPLPRGLAMIAGLMAGIGFCIKPQSAVIFIVIQLLVLWRARSLGAVFALDTVLAVITGALYLLSVAVFTPEYFEVIVPMALKTYAASNRGDGIYFSMVGSVFMLAVTLCDFRLRYHSPYRRDIYYLFAVGAACAVYVALNNGWGYTFVPVNTIILLVTGWIYFDYCWLLKQQGYTPAQLKQFLFGSRACLLNFAGNTLLVLVTLIIVFTNMPAAGDIKDIRMEMARELSQRGANRFGVISMHFPHWPSVANASGADQATRFSNLWMMDAFQKYPKEFGLQNAWIPGYVAQKYAEDLRRNKPEVVFVELPKDDPRHEPLIQLLPFAGLANEWQAYEQAGMIDMCSSAAKGQIIPADCLYGVYVRKAIH